MGDPPLSEEDLEKLIKLDEAIRADNVSPTSLEPDSLPPGMRSVAETLWSLNQSYVPTAAKKFAGMPHAIGKYQIRSVLGVGGHGIVYLGDDPQLRRVVALKVPLPGRINDHQSRQRFVQEVKTTAMLDHPNIVPVYDAGIDGDEVFLALAYCPGPPLDEWLKSYDQPVSSRLAATILQSLASAVDYSHRQGIIHRDLKPGNVLLFQDPHPSYPDFPYTPKITDFGLAKLLDDRDTKTATLQLQGTPQYMAPEQLIQGKRISTPAIDIYALGVLLYRLLVGRTPFQFESIEEAVRKIEFQRPIPPHVIQSSVPYDLSIITMKCLEKSPSDRYKTAGDFGKDLGNFLRGRPIQARPPSLTTASKHWCREHPVFTLLLAAGALLLTTFCALEYRYTRNVLAVNNALTQSRNQLLDQDQLLQAKVRELNQALATAESQQEELKRRDVYAKQMIYSADIAAAAQSIREQDPSRARRVLAPYFSQDASKDGASVVPEFTAKHLWSRLRPTHRVYPSDTQALWAVAVSPDGNTVATAGSEGKIALRDTRDDVDSIRILRSEPVEINSVSFSRDGRLLAAARDDGRVAIWDLESEQWLRSFQAIPGEAYAVRFLGDSHACAVAGRSSDVFLWNADSATLIKTIPVELDKPLIECLDVSDDGTVIAVGGTDGFAYVLDTSGNQLVSFRVWGWSSVNSVSLVPHGPVGSYSLMIADKLGKLTLCHGRGGAPLSLNFQDPIQCIANLGDGLFLCGDRAGGLSLIEAQRDDAGDAFVKLEVLHRWAHHDGSVQAISLGSTASPLKRDGGESTRKRALSRHIYTVSRTGQCFQVDLRNLASKITASHVPENPGGRCDFADMAEDGSVVCHVTGSVVEWTEIPSLKRSSIDTARHELTSVGMVPGTSQWMIANTAGEIATIDRSALGNDPAAIEWKTVFPESDFAEITLHPNHRWYAAIGGSVGFPLRVRDRMTEETLFAIDGCKSMAFTSDGTTMAVGRRSSNSIEIFDTVNWKQIAVLKNHRSTINVLEFSDDGRWLVSCSDDRMACFWDGATWELRDTIVLPGTMVTSMAISPDSRTLAVSDLAGRITVWDMSTRRDLMMLKAEGVPVLKVSFVADGTKLFAWNGNNELEVFETLDRPFVYADRDE